MELDTQQQLNKKICRTCLSVDDEGNFFDLFGSEDMDESILAPLPDMITECTNFPIKRGDNYPNGICYKCLDGLKIAYNFKKQCENSFKILTTIIEKYKNLPYDDCLESIFINELDIKSESASTQTDVMLMYPCERCDEKFLTFDNLEKHLKHYHDERKCRICSKVFVRVREKGENGMEANESSDEYLEINHEICESCHDFYSQQSNDLKNIIDENNKDGSDIPWQYICAVCSETFSSEEALKNHPCEDNCAISMKSEGTGNEENLSERRNPHNDSEDYSQSNKGANNSETESFIRDNDGFSDDDEFVMKEENLLDDEDDDDDSNVKEEPDDDDDDNLTEVQDKRNRRQKHVRKCKKSISTKRTKPQCEICDKLFSRTTHLKRHMLTHTDEKPFICKICNKGFTRSDHLNVHMHHHSDTKPFTCEICERGFTRAEHLRKHKESRHVGNREKTPKTEFCEICQKGFTTAKYLHIHMKSHTDRIWSCKNCPEKFKTKPELTAHSKTHAVNEKPFLCSECGLRFVRNDYLVIHMRRHKGEKPYKCKFCGKGFPRATDLTVHERYHTGEKTHLCTICGKGFQRAYNLLVHMRVHTGERPYQCPHCTKRFAQGNDLKAHIRRHTGERFKCDICGDGFIQGYHLTQHKRNVHGIDMKSHIRRVEKFVTPIEQQKQMEALKTQLKEGDEVVREQNDDENDEQSEITAASLAEVEIIKIEDEQMDVTEAISISVEQAEMLENGQEITVIDGNNIAMISYFNPPKSKVKYESTSK